MSKPSKREAKIARIVERAVRDIAALDGEATARNQEISRAFTLGYRAGIEARDALMRVRAPRTAAPSIKWTQEALDFAIAAYEADRPVDAIAEELGRLHGISATGKQVQSRVIRMGARRSAGFKADRQQRFVDGRKRWHEQRREARQQENMQ